MSDEQALLSAIVAHPDEDTPRLMYADWLDEQGGGDREVRAEFIRVQIELERMPEFGRAEEESRRAVLLLRERALLEAHAGRWLAGVPVRNERFHPHRVNFRRGFPERGSFHIDYLHQSAADVFAHPLLRRIGISPINEHSLVDLLQCPWITELRGLELSPVEGAGLPPDWSLLGCSPNLHRLDSLALNFGGTLDRIGAARIAANPALANVHTLSVKEETSVDAIPQLLEGPAFRALSRLELKHFRGDRPLVPDLAGDPRLGSLEELRLVGYASGTDDLERLTQGVYWNNVRSFEFSYGGFGLAAVDTLSVSPGEQLQSLTLTGNENFWSHQLCGPILWGLRSLDVSGHHCEFQGLIQYLAESAESVGLWNLNLGSCWCVNDAIIEVIATAPAFSQLRWLDLHNTGITDAGARMLATSPQLEQLGLLKLHGCKLGRIAKLSLQGRFGDRVRL